MSIKFFRIAALIAKFSAQSALVEVRERSWEHVARKRKNLLSQSCVRALKILGVENKVFDPKQNLQKFANPSRQDSAVLILANHCSYLDMLLISSQIPTLFVSSVDRQNDGLLGKISQMAGTIFVDRIQKSKLPQDIRTIGAYLRRGLPVCIFPEGTTSNGRTLLPFKSSLLRAVEGNEVTILPLCLRYKRVNQNQLSGTQFDQIAWHGDMDFLPHFQTLLRFRKIEAELFVLDPIRVEPTWTRKEITRRAESAISNAFWVSQRGILEHVHHP